MAALDATLAHIHLAGTAHFKIRSLSAPAFCARAKERLSERLADAGLPDTAEHADRLLQTLPAHDFVLAIAFEHGDRDELTRILHTTAMPILERAYRRLGATAQEAEVRAQETTESLVFGGFRRDSQPGFHSYQAKSPLASWLVGVAWHDWKMARRTQARTPAAGASLSAAGEALFEMHSDPRNPFAALEQAELTQLVEAAMREAVTHRQVEPDDLDAFARATLSRRQHQALAARLGIPPSTFSRRKERGGAAIAAAARATLLARTPPGEFLRLRGELEGSALHGNRIAEAARRFCWWALRHLRRARAAPATRASTIVRRRP
jgi:DNA-directed RNA polymerase specialized sigma24 family protein